MGQRPKLSQQRRLRTLEAAAEIIAERGLCDTRVADIAERAGSSAGLILYYFESKDTLLTEALTFADDRFYLNTFHELSRLERASDRLVRLVELSCPRGGPASEPGDDWTLWMELWTRALRDPRAAKKRETLDRRWRATIADIVREGQKAGEFDARVNADDFAAGLAAMIDGFAIQVVLGDSEMTTSQMRKLCLESASSQLGFRLDESDRSQLERA
jgi:AcrR family transcriptional regulator